MALSDDCPIKITATEYRPSGQGELELWLGKESAAAKVAAAPKLEDNEDESTAAYGDLYEKPKDRKDGTNIDSRWGEGLGQESPVHNNAATFHDANQERRDVTSRALSTFPAASAADRALLSANFEHVKSGDFTSHSVLLHDQTKQASLSERVKNVLAKI